MRISRLSLRKIRNLLRFAIACALICVIGASTFAQYKGAPVKKERLLKALRSRQLQTSDIVTVINSNGVDFAMTPEIKKALILAGARPEVINAVANNQRLDFNGSETLAKKKRSGKTSAERDYEELFNQAIYSFEDKKDAKNAVRFLQAALKMKPKDAKAYQMLGFISLYGLNNPTEAQKYMRESILNGGSAVFRVYHDDKGSFAKRCTGSLYISPERIRFESDDNIHTFETSTVNVDKIELDRETSKVWKNHPIYKVFLKIGKDKVRFRFAPINGKLEESQMATRFIEESRTNDGFTGAATASLK